MRIVMKKAGVGETLLCEGADRTVGRLCGPTGLKIVSPTVGQPRRTLRAATGGMWDRGGVTTQVRFGITRACASHAEANAWLAQHAASVVRSDQLLLQAVEAASRTTVTLSAALLHIAESEVIGATVRVEYLVEGGGLSVL